MDRQTDRRWTDKQIEDGQTEDGHRQTEDKQPDRRWTDRQRERQNDVNFNCLAVKPSLFSYMKV